MRFIFLFSCLFVSSLAPAQKTFWPTAKPEDAGLSSVELNKIFDYVQTHQTKVHSIQVLRHGNLVFDAYFFPFKSNSRHDVASVTKSITSTLVGIATDKNLIADIHQTALSYFPSFKSTDQKKNKITLEDLITMRSGFDCGTDLSDPRINVDQRLIEIRKCPDWVNCILDLPMAKNPGTQFAYCNGNCHLISAIVATATKKTSMDAFANEVLFTPLNITEHYWPVDPKGVNYGWSDLQLYPYDMLKIGQMLLKQGKWNGKEIVSEKWLQTATREHVINTGGKDHYGYFWWVPGGDYPDVFEAVGRGGQRITVWPSKDLVIVFTGGGFDTSELVQFIAGSIQSDGPISPNDTEYKKLTGNLVAITKAPSHVARKKSPVLEKNISNKTFKLAPNGLDITTLQLILTSGDSATLNLIWAGKTVRCTVGLDGVPRFSFNPIIHLEQACSGGWINENSFVLKLDLVGGINSYTIGLQYSVDGNKVVVTLSEGTGLNNETILGESVK